MEIATIHVHKREATGTRKVRQLRDENKVPAVLYGDGQQSLPIAIDHDELTKHLRHHLRVYQLDLAGKTQGCYLKEVLPEGNQDHGRANAGNHPAVTHQTTHVELLDRAILKM